MFRRSRSAPRRPAPRASFRPRLEHLEVRDAPAVFTVTNLTDNDRGSLRAELALTRDGDTVNFAPDLSGTIVLTSGELPVAYNVTISGPGADVVAVSGNYQQRVFNIRARATVATGVTLSGLTITAGSVGAVNANTQGGGILNASTLNLVDDAIAGNTVSVVGLRPGFSASGGGVYSSGPLTVVNCTVSGNTANAVTGGIAVTYGAAYGGGIAATDALRVASSVIDGNAARGAGYGPEVGPGPGPGYGPGDGGGIYAPPSAIVPLPPPVTVADSTLSNNVASSGGSAAGGAVYAANGLALTGGSVTGNSVLVGAVAPLAHVSASGGGVAGANGVTVATSTIANNTTSCSGYDDSPASTDDTTLSAAGGGLSGSGTLALADSTVRDNTATATRTNTSRPIFGAAAAGGGISWETVSVSGSTIASNAASATNRGGSPRANALATGGGLSAVGLRTANSTVTGNAATAANGGPGGGSALAHGGGIAVSGGASFTSLTVARNSVTATLLDPAEPPTNAEASGGGIHALSPSLIGPQIRNSIVAANTRSGFTGAGPDAHSEFTSLGYNLIGIVDAGSSGWVNTDLLGTPRSPLDPLLGPPQDNGGPTWTLELLAGSPALNAGDPGLAGTTDQRGVARGLPVAIGAYQATPDHSVLAIPTPEVQAGVPFSLLVGVVDIFGKAAAGYTGTVDLSSTDPLAPDLGSHTFSLGDGGQFTFTTLVLYTPGVQTLTATDGTLAGSLDLLVIP